MNSYSALYDLHAAFEAGTVLTSTPGKSPRR
jgi:hypothetical protein